MSTPPAPRGRLRRGPVPAWLGTPLTPLYGAIIARRNRRFDAGTGVVTLDRPVISVGNLSVGGTGKTPMVAHIARLLRDAGRSPAIAMRGYTRPGSTESDEALVYAAELPGVPVVAQPDRVEGLLDLFATQAGERVDCVILDDGFQHRRLARCCDVVLLDATRDPFEDALLPSGWLREPVTSLRRAHAVIVTHAEAAGRGAADRILRRVHEIAPGLVTGICSHEWAWLHVRHSNSDRREETSWLTGRRVVACCAVGNPHAFFARASRECVLADTIELPDHDPYRPRTVRRIVEAVRRARAEVLLVTRKDAVKLTPTLPAGIVLAWPDLVLQFDAGERELASLVLAGTSPRAEIDTP